MSETFKTIALFEALNGSGGGGGGLPAVTSADNGKVLAVKDGAWAADSNLFLVTVENNVSDKTYTEIVNAVNQGKTVVMKTGTYYMQYVRHDNYNVAFSFENTGISRFITYYYVKASGNGKVVSSASVYVLPSINSNDNGSELIVKNDLWAKQQKKFIVTLTPTSPDYSGTMDKTANEITAAYEAGQEIVFNVVGFPGFDHVYIPAAWCTYATDTPRCAACATLVDVNSGTQIIILTSDADNGATYFTSVYALTPAS